MVAHFEGEGRQEGNRSRPSHRRLLLAATLISTLLFTARTLSNSLDARTVLLEKVQRPSRQIHVSPMSAIDPKIGTYK